MEKYAEVHCSTVASLLADYKIGRKTEREGKRGRERGPCPEQLKPPGQPGVTDSQHHRAQGASFSGKSSNPPSLSCSPRGRRKKDGSR